MPTRRGAIAAAVIGPPTTTTAAPTGFIEVNDQRCGVGQLSAGPAHRAATGT